MFLSMFYIEISYSLKTQWACHFVIIAAYSWKHFDLRVLTLHSMSAMYLIEIFSVYFDLHSNGLFLHIVSDPITYWVRDNAKKRLLTLVIFFFFIQVKGLLIECTDDQRRGKETTSYLPGKNSKISGD